MTTFNTSSVQKKIFTQGWEQKLVNAAFFSLSTPCSILSLRERWDELVAAHDILRTRLQFREQIRYPFQVVGEDATRFAIIEAGTLTRSGMASDARNQAFRSNGQVTLSLYEQHCQVHFFALSAPACLLDSFSLQLLARQLTAPEVSLPDPLQYGQYVEWQESLAQEKDTLPAGLSAVWDTSAPAITIPLEDGTGIAAHTDIRCMPLEMDSRIWNQISFVAEREGVSTTDLLWHAWNTTLHCYNSNDSWTTGFISQGRDFEEFRQIAGVFARKISLALHKNEDLHRVKENLELSESCREYDQRGILEPGYPPAGMAFEFLPVTQIPAEFRHSRLDCVDILSCPEPSSLQLIITDAGPVSLRLQYDPNAYTENAVACIGRLFLQVIQAWIAGEKPSLQLTPGSGIGTAPWTDTQSYGPVREIPFQPLTAMFRAAAVSHASGPAMVTGNSNISYETLLHQAESVATVLIETFGIQPGDRVVLHLKRSSIFIAAMWGVMLAGATYIPVDTQYPARRLAFILNDAGARLLIAEAEPDFSEAQPDEGMGSEACTLLLLADLVAQANHTPPVTAFPEWLPEQVVYIIYTSGTTGNPKGCLISMDNLLHYISWANSYYFTMGNRGNFPLFTSIAFDLTVTCIFTTLTRGACLFIFPDNEAVSAAMEEIFNGSRPIDTVKLTPSHIRLLPYIAISRTTVSTCIVGGEKLLPHDVDILRALNPSMRICNEYGPTECTVGCITWDVPEHYSTISIGRPIDNSVAVIRNETGEVLAPGLTGEIWIGGKTTGLGYCNNPVLTAAKFVESPLINGVLYRTGDLGYCDTDGNLFCTGRTDEMVKVNGYRIELDAITHTALEIELLTEAFTTTRALEHEGMELVTYYVAADAVTETEVRAYLERQLPPYMVPAHLVKVPGFRLTTNGKLDKSALPTPEQARQSQLKAFAAPVTEAEQVLAAAWRQVLGKPEVGIDDHFLSIGGDSIKAIQVTGRLRETGWKASVREIMLYPTIRELAAHLRADQAGTLAGPENGVFPLTPLQIKFLSDNQTGLHHYNQSIVLTSSVRIDMPRLRDAITKIQERHPMLRATFTHTAQGWEQRISAPGSWPDALWEQTAPVIADEAAWVSDQMNAAQQSMDLAAGPLFRCFVYHLAEQDLLFLLAHHLIIDGVSWRILLNEIETLYARPETSLPLPHGSYRDWAQQLQQKAGQITALEQSYWEHTEKLFSRRKVFSDRFREQVFAHYQFINSSLTAEESRQLLAADFARWNTTLTDVLLVALSGALYQWKNEERTVIYLESHGRNSTDMADMFAGTIGWFTVKYPVVLHHTPGVAFPESLAAHRQAMNNIPGEGEGYFINRYLGAEQPAELSAEPEFSFNYLGHMEPPGEGQFTIHPLTESRVNIGPGIYMPATVFFTLVVSDSRLQVGISYHTALYEKSEIERLLHTYQAHIREVATALQQKPEPVATQKSGALADFGLDLADLEQMIQSL